MVASVAMSMATLIRTGTHTKVLAAEAVDADEGDMEGTGVSFAQETSEKEMTDRSVGSRTSTPIYGGIFISGNHLNYAVNN
ncbi:MAG: hypothetical protein F6K42_34685 [Leptolyngbya sp. SIO1D8]|nr:hypothetical protein [Leptolyngbya sp. SIO1D8]